MPRTFWRVQVYDALALLCDATIPASKITEKGLSALLATLVAKYGLQDDEIVSAHLKRPPRKNNSARSCTPERVR